MRAGYKIESDLGVRGKYLPIRNDSVANIVTQTSFETKYICKKIAKRSKAVGFWRIKRK